MTSSAEPPPRLDALLRDALAAEDARLAALEARVSALRRAPRPAQPPAQPPVKDGTTKVDLKAHPGHPGDQQAAALARVARAHMTGDGPGYEDTVPIRPATDEAQDLDEERLEAARRILLESSQSLADLRACLAGVAPDDTSQPGVGPRPTSAAPPWALELIEGVATIHGSLARLEQLLVEVGRAVAAVLERSRPGTAPVPEAVPVTRESPTARLRRVLAESARRAGERTPSSTARAAREALDATVDGAARRSDASAGAERKAILEAFELLAKVIPRLSAGPG